MSTRARKIARLKNKAYRDAFIGSQISVGLPFQIRALREQRGWKQSRLAMEAGMLQPRISAMESPGAAKFNLETLRRLASAFDVALMVRFVPFSELVDWSERFDPDKFNIPSFKDEQASEESVRQAEAAVEAYVAIGHEAARAALGNWAQQLEAATQPFLTTPTANIWASPEISATGKQRKWLSAVQGQYPTGPYGRLVESGAPFSVLPLALYQGVSNVLEKATIPAKNQAATGLLSAQAA